MIDYVAFGIILDDLVFPEGRLQMCVLGGGGAQTAWGMAAALGWGDRVGLVAGIGDDLPNYILSPLINAGINLDGVRMTELPTPRAWQINDYGGRRTQVWRTPPQHLEAQLAKNWDVLPDSYRAAQHFHWGIHPEDEPSLTFAHQLRVMGKTVSLEPFKPASHPLDPQAQADLFMVSSVFSPTPEELASIIGSELTQDDALSAFSHAAGRYFVLREGTSGATAFDLAAKNFFYVPALSTAVVDEVGAGNAFCGAFLARLDEGCSEALCHGAVAASYMIEQVGLPLHLPDKGDYQRRLDLAHKQLTSGFLTLKSR